MHGGGDFMSSGMYFSTYANHVSSVQIRGVWRNVIIDGSRDEEDRQPATAPDCGFVELRNGRDGSPLELAILSALTC